MKLNILLLNDVTRPERDAAAGQENNGKGENGERRKTVGKEVLQGKTIVARGNEGSKAGVEKE